MHRTGQKTQPCPQCVVTLQVLQFVPKDAAKLGVIVLIRQTMRNEQLRIPPSEHRHGLQTKHADRSRDAVDALFNRTLVQQSLESRLCGLPFRDPTSNDPLRNQKPTQNTAGSQGPNPRQHRSSFRSLTAHFKVNRQSRLNRRWTQRRHRSPPRYRDAEGDDQPNQKNDR